MRNAGMYDAEASHTVRRAGAARGGIAPATAAMLGLALALTAGTALASKDIGPSNATCDGLAKESAAWKACAARVASASSDAELFYAGYWLAKNGSYREALEYLRRAEHPDERVLTYIGFATRKLGDVDGAMRFYDQALARNPDYSVARAYMGEAFLTRGEPAKAVQQLGEIEKRCGKTCAEYADLAGHIADWRAGKRG